MLGRMRLDPAHWVIAFGVFVAAAISIGAALYSATLYDDALDEAEHSLQDLALVLAEQTERAFQTIEVVQGNILDRLKNAGAGSSDDLRRVAPLYNTYELLREQAEPLPHVDALSITDDQGRLLNVSRSWPIPEMDFADRSYFRALRSDQALQSFVSEPIFSRVANNWTFIIARKIVGAEGQFIGVLSAVIELGYFERLYQEIAVSPGRAVALVRQDGILLARYPRSEATLKAPAIPAASPIRTLLGKASPGTVRNVSVVDGQDRIVTANNLKRYPVALLLSDTVQMALSKWRSQVALLGVIAVLMNLAVAAACWLGFRQIRAIASRADAESHLARHDTLTGLPNRILFNEEMERMVGSATQAGKGFAVLLLDLDQFKEVNDTRGHLVGDALLQGIAKRLRSNVREGDVVARIGGDEFAIIQHDIRGPEEATALAKRLVQTASRPFDLHGQIVSVGVSVGLALAPDDGSDPERLLKSADMALYSAKGEGRGTFRFYDAAMDARRAARRAIEHDLRRAVDAGEFELFFQPFLDLRTNRITGFEALLRWRHSERGLLPPQTFIPAAEDTGLIGRIGDWVLHEACRQAVAWPSSIKVAVNVSAVQFKIGDVLAAVEQALASSGLVASRLELEITESALVEDPAFAATLLRLKELGVSLALDDFGTGYASMSYLRSFPFDKIKIDRSFVQEMGHSSGSAAIVYATLDLAQRLGMTTTAEGVETDEQLRALREAGCTKAQGFLIARPMAAQDTLTFLARTPAPV